MEVGPLTALRPRLQALAIWVSFVVCALLYTLITAVHHYGTG
jgi:hypothetical protein